MDPHSDVCPLLCLEVHPLCPPPHRKTDLLMSLQPQGALLWLDFLAVKSGNSAWLLSLLSTWDAAITELGWKEASAGERERIALWALPGLGWAKALALRAEENARKDKEHEASNKALREAVLTFPWVLPLLADKGR